jgi:hypothetical protein
VKGHEVGENCLGSLLRQVLPLSKLGGDLLQCHSGRAGGFTRGPGANRFLCGNSHKLLPFSTAYHLVEGLLQYSRAISANAIYSDLIICSNSQNFTMIATSPGAR